LVAHLAVAVGIKKAKKFCAVANSSSEGTVVLQEHHNVVGANFFMGLAVDATEGGVGRECGFAAKRLSVAFNNDLRLRDGV
jgi:hypothetical protein